MPDRRRRPGARAQVRTSTACTANSGFLTRKTSRHLDACARQRGLSQSGQRVRKQRAAVLALSSSPWTLDVLFHNTTGTRAALRASGRPARAATACCRNFGTKSLPYLQGQRGVREGGQRGRRRGAGAAVAQPGRRVLHHHTALARPHLLHQRVLNVYFFGSV